MSPPERSAIALAWYRPDQWTLLRAIAADPEVLEPTYEAWLAFASKTERDLKARGLRVCRIDVEVGP